MPFLPTQEKENPLQFCSQPGIHNEFQTSQSYTVRTMSQTKTKQNKISQVAREMAQGSSF